MTNERDRPMSGEWEERTWKSSDREIAWVFNQSRLKRLHRAIIKCIVKVSK